MRIAMVTETFWPEINGVAMTLHRLLSGLEKRNHEVQLICPRHTERDMSKFASNIRYNPVNGLAIPGYKDALLGLPSLGMLSRLWKLERPDVIYVATEGPLGYFAVKNARALGIPIVSGFHTNFHTYSKHYKLGFFEFAVKKYLAYLHNKTNITVVPTLDQKKHLLEMGISDVTILGRGVDTNLFSPSKRNEDLRQGWGVEACDPVMIYVGRIAAEKNLDLTIKTYQALYKINNKLKLVLVGDGPLTNSIRKDNPEFIFAGIQQGEQLAQHFASGDLFIFSSVTETFGNVILEAMASGLAIVAYDYAAAHLHIKHEHNGLVAKIGSEEEFINSSRQLLQDNFLQQKCRSNANHYALTQNWESVVMSFENILLTVSHLSPELMQVNFENGTESKLKNLQ